MEKHQLQIILRFLEDRREFFISEVNEFHMSLSPSFSPIDPYFDIDLSLLNEEIVHNLSFEDQSQITTYYQKIIKELESDNFTESHPPYLAQNNIDYYQDRADFLDKYYADNPNDTNGEGELEWIKLCFNGFLNSYNVFLQTVIETMQKQISKSAQEGEEVFSDKMTEDPPLNQGFSHEKLKRIIYEKSRHLAGTNSRLEKIMSEDDFKRLQNDIFEIIALKRLPENKQEYELNGITAESIRYTLSLIHKDVYRTRKKNSNFALFLRYWFPKQFGEWKVNTIHGKLNKPQPKIYP